MKQLKMNWLNDMIMEQEPNLPDGFSVKNYTEVDNAMEHWLDIVQYGISKGRADDLYYKKTMLERPCYNEKDCLFVMKGACPIATITVICNYEKKDGYVHMVACKPEARGQGIGRFLADLAVYILKKEGMKTAYLTTDDWRIPAIKTYLKVGFTPDLSTSEFEDRWKKVLKQCKT